ncbi:DcuS/MalK family sensor histidine kinase [Paenibacillus sp. sgz500958]|uniref:DcuS/MalK family sensor histidine kinase n=1 Tax=Paenibacillus sp. sgz500958 TaxID=3242475 RepID=UPI0036D29E06
MNRKKRIYRLRTVITLMFCAVLVLILLMLYVIFSVRTGTQTRRSLEDKAIAIARTVALTPVVQEGLQAGESREISTFAAKIQRINDVRFVVVIDMKGIRYSHPNPSEIGKRFRGGDEGAALRGEMFISEGEGVLGKSVRAFMPVYSGRGVQLGAVVVGISLSKVEQNVGQNKWIIAAALALGAVLGAFGAMLLARKIKNLMFGLEPVQISELLEERSAMLQSTREGIIAVDDQGRITLMNQEAERLLRYGAHSSGFLKDQDIRDYWPDLRLGDVLEGGQALQDEEISLNGISLLANSLPIHVNEVISGAVITFRDKTEMVQLAQRLSGVSLYAEALRAQTHEFMNKLHVVMGMSHMGLHDELVEYVSETVGHYNEDIGSLTRKVKDPVMAGFLLGKLSRAREAGVQLILEEDSFLPEADEDYPEITHELITIVGNLLDNAIEALQDRALKEIRLSFQVEQGQLTCTVKDSGGGVPERLREHIFTHGFSTKGTNRGIGLYLVKRSVDHLNGTLTLITGPESGTHFQAVVPYAAKEDTG